MSWATLPHSSQYEMRQSVVVDKFWRNRNPQWGQMNSIRIDENWMNGLVLVRVYQMRILNLQWSPHANSESNIVSLSNYLLFWRIIHQSYSHMLQFSDPLFKLRWNTISASVYLKSDEDRPISTSSKEASLILYKYFRESFSPLDLEINRSKYLDLQKRITSSHSITWYDPFFV